MIKLSNFPMPPSINAQLTLSKGRFIKTQAARLYDQKVQLYKLRKFRELDNIKNIFNENDLLKVDCIFVFHKDRIIGKKNQIKTLDVNNFLKSALDGLVKCINIDDKFFIEHNIKKITCNKISDEQIIFNISKVELENYG